MPRSSEYVPSSSKWVWMHSQINWMSVSAFPVHVNDCEITIDWLTTLVPDNSHITHRKFQLKCLCQIYTSHFIFNSRDWSYSTITNARFPLLWDQLQMTQLTIRIWSQKVCEVPGYKVMRVERLSYALIRYVHKLTTS